jgi:hypothetical protein
VPSSPHYDGRNAEIAAAAYFTFVRYLFNELSDELTDERTCTREARALSTKSVG